MKYKVCKYFDGVYEKTIAKGITKEEAKEIKNDATIEYGYDHISYKIKEDENAIVDSFVVL